MVFPSVPVYLDHSTWLQQQNLHQARNSAIENPQLQVATVPPPSPIGGGGTVVIRPYSVSERARLAKLSQPEAPLECPRCESNNTKFCYFNNYSLLQPRHFCKTCRRYWTRGGALRNVPVGGGCRRSSKKSKGSRSKSPISLERRQTYSASTTPISSNSCSSSPLENNNLETNKFITNTFLSSQFLPFPSLLDVTAFSNTRGSEHGGQIGHTSARTETLIPSAAFGHQWMSPHQIHHLEQRVGAHHFEGEGISPLGHVGVPTDVQVGSRSELEKGFTQLCSIRQEQNQGSSLPKSVSSFPGNDQNFGGIMWRDISGSATSSGHFM